MNSPAGTSRIRFILWMCVVTWMAVIFFLSAQEASQSSSLSGSAIWSVAEITQPGFRDMPRDEQESLVEQYQHIARKTAHMLAYMVLGVFLGICSVLFAHWVWKTKHAKAQNRIGDLLK